MNKQVHSLTCPEHSTYQAKRKPRQTKKHPKGCLRCWLVWHTQWGF